MALTVAQLAAATYQQLSAEKVTDTMGLTLDQVTMFDIEDGSVGGGTNDTVLRFNSANDVTTGTGMAITHDATDGDSVTITKRGWYLMEFTFSAAASDEVRLGLSADVAAAGLTDDPAMAIPGMLDVGGGLLPAATTAYWKLSSLVSVTEAEAAAGKVLRFHGSDAADGVIADAAIDENLDCHARITRISDLLA
jgi:hypothetical protein